jgi:hypothetical protein
MNTPEQAIAVAARQSAHGPRYGTGECLMRVHDAYGVPSDGTHDAATAWLRSRFKHPKPADAGARPAWLAGIPRGALLYWTGGTHGYGHIAICAGHGMMWSTDIRRPGYFDLVPIEEVQRLWRLELVGWAEDVDGVHVFTPPHPHPLVRAVVHAAPGLERRRAMERLAAHGAPKPAGQARAWLRADDNKRRILDSLHGLVS